MKRTVGMTLVLAGFCFAADKETKVKMQRSAVAEILAPQAEQEVPANSQ